MDESKKVIKSAGLGTRIKERMGLATPAKEYKNDFQKAYGKSLLEEDKTLCTPSFEDVKKGFVLVAKELCNKDYLIDDQNKSALNALCLYFSKDEKFNTFKYDNEWISILNEPSLDKGILIFGNTGFGKSLIMRVFKKLSIVGNRFYFHDAHEIVMKYSQRGYDALDNYMKNDCLYDDLGMEEKASHYEKGKELFKTIIEIRYNQFINKGFKTHMTTNLNPDEIKERYGDRIESRIYEMFNIIVVSGTDRRKSIEDKKK